MIFLFGLIPALIGLAAAPADDGGQVRSSLVENEFVTRVTVRPNADASAWEAVKGPECLRLGFIRGALLSGQGQVDFVMASARRFRARFDSDCPALDFYDGFYVNSPNRMICAGRDSIRSRMGANCAIESFSELVPRDKRLP